MRYKTVLILVIPLLFMTVNSCDDAGLLPTDTPAGKITFTQQTKLITLNPSVDNYLYNMWILFGDSLGGFYFRKLGNFNVNSAGVLVDPSGNPVELSILPEDTTNLG
ncbi:MAG: hypothetical protein N2510_04555, partial [Ignavibacteria bacterium]|nr:hypothetical protein [Ignavibacteria bacterium]